MKNIWMFFAATAVAAALLSSCQMDKPDFADPNAFKSPATSPGPSGSSSSTSGNSTSNGSWQPVSNGSYWKYVSTGIMSDSTTQTMTGTTTTINGKQYYNETSVSQHYKMTSTNYFYSGNHTYSMRGTTLVDNIVAEFLYLNDTTAVGHSWTSAVTDSGTVNGAPARMLGTMKERDISKTVGSKTYNDVMHTQLELQYNILGSGFQTWGTYDYYIAKGVGIVEIDSNIMGGFTSTITLYDYSIK